MELLMETDEATEVRELTKMDRCDKRSCSAQAYTLAVKEDLELIFCGHHGRLLEPALAGAGWTVHFQLHLMEE